MAFLGFLGPGDRDKRRPFFSRKRRSRRGGGWILPLLLGGFVCALPARAQSREYQLKAAFLYNFVQFVEWPPGAFPSSDAPLRIGVLGDDPFGGALDEAIQNESVDSHRLTVVRSSNIADLQDCQMIFVSQSEEGHLGEILSAIGSKPVLTVSDIDHFAQSGGDIGFFLSDGKVRFAINPGSARQSGLRISSQLLTLGRIVGGGN